MNKWNSRQFRLSAVQALDSSEWIAVTQRLGQQLIREALIADWADAFDAARDHRRRAPVRYWHWPRDLALSRRDDGFGSGREAARHHRLNHCQRRPAMEPARFLDVS